MATITNNRYTDNGITYDARTGQQVNDTGLVPTPVQMDARAAASVASTTPDTPAIAPSSSTPTRYTDPNNAAGAMFAPGGVFGARALPTAEEEAKIREQQRTAVQAQIDAVQQLSAIELSSAQERATARLARNRAMLANSGQLGSGSETTSTEEVNAKNKAEEDAILADRAAKIAVINSGVETTSRDIIEKQKTLATTNANAYLTYLTSTSEAARTKMKDLATLGADLTPEQKQSLADQTGYDATTFDQLYQGMKIANSTDYINKDKPIISDDGKTATYIKQDKKTGAFTTEVVKLPGGKNSALKSVVARDDGLYAFYEDGTWEKVGEAQREKPVSLAEGSRLVDPVTGRVITGSASGGSGSGGGASSGIAVRDADSIMAGTLNLTDTSTENNYRGTVAAELRERQKKALASGDIFGVMRASAAYDKEPGDTFLTSMEKTATVISQIGVLQESIAGMSTGPIVGAFRSANPWDTKAQVIKAELNAIVPNLARGVYGEVGVLTDNDIKQYSKTLPTLTSTEAIRNAILYITVEQIRKNIATKIKNQAAGQRDMSGYADMYKELEDLSQNILGTIPGAVGASGGESGGGASNILSKDGQSFDASALTDEEYQQALKDGYVAQ